MKKTKVWITVLLLVLTLSLAACGKSPVQNGTPPIAPPLDNDPTQAAPAPTDEPPAPVPNPESDPPPAPEVIPSAVEPSSPQPPAEASSEATDPTESDESSEPTKPTEPAGPSVPAESGVVHHGTVPILMYHEVNDLLANSLYLSVADFTAHLNYFEQAGIEPISMQQLYDHWFNEAPLPEKPIVLTFDDGYRSMYTTVYPLLKERGWSGTFYCITSTFENPGHLTAEMIAEMAAGGMEIGSHTVSHLELNSLGSERLDRELAESREILATLTAQEINMLCYPAGRYNDATKVAASDTGYLTGVTTQYGFAKKSQGMFDLKRIRVSTDCGAGWMKEVLTPLGY
ncbi:MAG: polysaccharide deacetylase family protein [Oscillospiraceae bacterium]|nr:polysaccharide deacetylase family protein [Oscillospiraceae bacterium]